MIGAVCYKVTNEYEVRIYKVGTYDQIDWENRLPCMLGKRYFGYEFVVEDEKNADLILTYGLDGQPILRLRETKRYVLRLVYESGEEVELPHFQNESNKFLRLERDRDSVIFQFINYLGRSKIMFGPTGSENAINFEVIPDKMDYEEDYVALTEALAQNCSELLLEYAGATSNKFGQSINENKTIFEQFIFLRQFCYRENLLGLFEAIKRNPDRILIYDDALKPIGQGGPSRKFYTNPFSYSRGWEKVKHCDEHVAYIPQYVSVTQKHDNMDTPANRFIKFALHKFDDICLQLINSAENLKQTECFCEAQMIHGMLEKIFNDPFFTEIGMMDIMPQNNQVLQKREGYSQIFTAYTRVDLALKLDWKGKDEVFEGESKNVSLLYEYWLFFELYKIVCSINGCLPVQSEESSFLKKSDDGLTILLEEGQKSCQFFTIKKLHAKINLYYNRTFLKKPFQTTVYEGSYSRPFRPDYTIAIFPDVYKGVNNGENAAVKDGTVSYIHFDAKYRISDLTSFIGNGDGDIDKEFVEEKTDAVANTYKRGDLLKMHTYNDAIRRTIGSFVLYPGKVSDERNVFHLYDEILPGVGAFAIRPGINGQAEERLKKFIISLLESKGSSYSRLNRMIYYSEMVLKEPKVSLGVARNFDNEDEMILDMQGEKCILGYIKASSETDYFQSLVKSHLLIKGAEFYFYFYAIRDKIVYPHHPEIFKIKKFCFYTNSIIETNTYIPVSVLCNVQSNELVSKTELVRRLREQGYETSEEKHNADFYYVLKVKVIDDACAIGEMDVEAVNAKNGNDAYSPHSPKIITWQNKL